MSDPTLTTLAFLATAAFVAGWIDAVVGGGGLVQLPALLVGLPGASPAQLLATKYEQYRRQPPPGLVIAVTAVAWRAWPSPSHTAEQYG